MNTMSAEQARVVLATLTGYWPTPALTLEETVAWTTELVGPARINYAEAVAVIHAEKARQWRPRAGEFVELVQHYRRQEALRKPALPSGARIASRETSLEWISKCREMVK